MLDYDKDMQLLLDCVVEDMNQEYEQKIADQLRRQDEFMAEREKNRPNVDKLRDRKFKSRPLTSKETKERSVKVEVTKTLAQTFKLDPEWLFLEDAIFSSVDESPALVDLYNPSYWWDEGDVNVMPVPDPSFEERVDKYLRDSQSS